MSGSVPGGAKVEPNLTPILDMVFQLITFFMLVISFKAAELDQTLMLPVLGSARPLDASDMKVIVLNVQIATKCPQAGCESYATLVQNKDDSGKASPILRCERGHETPWPQGAISNGKTALSVFGHMYTKEKRDDYHPSFAQYLAGEHDKSLKATNPPMTDDEINKNGFPDTVVIRADANCPSGAVNDIITECQKQGYRKFALKSAFAVPPKSK
jgi:biopolymer transport protein ExbD